MLRNCIAGIDDGYFEKHWASTVLAMVIYCDSLPAQVYTTLVKIDGWDSTQKIIELIKRALSRGYLIEMVLLDTIVFAGFNIADPRKVYEETRVPVLVVYHYPPNRDKIVEALKKHFPDWRRRLAVLEETWSSLQRVTCPRGTLYAAVYGTDKTTAWNTLCSTQRFTRTPEPLYAAGVVASAFSRSLGPLTFKPGPAPATQENR